MAIGITFKETMKGPFALGHTDAAAGAEAGRTAGQELTMHAEITIPNLDAFIADPSHSGGLSGTVDFEPFGHGVASTTGVFNLFSPTGRPDTKSMIYELGFTVNGAPRYLAGRKIIRDDPGFDLWSDTTTLYTTLHDGNDRSGPVLGAGILGLGVDEFAALVSTMTTTGARTTLEKTEAIVRFGSFFAGQLWTTYGTRFG